MSISFFIVASRFFIYSLKSNSLVASSLPFKNKAKVCVGGAITSDDRAYAFFSDGSMKRTYANGN